MDNQEFLPFYERFYFREYLVIRFPSHFVDLVGKVSVAILLGLAFLVALMMSIGEAAFKDWNWFVR